MILLRKGSVVMKLEQCGLDRSQRFSFFDQARTTGMDIPKPKPNPDPKPKPKPNLDDDLEAEGELHDPLQVEDRCGYVLPIAHLVRGGRGVRVTLGRGAMQARSSTGPRPAGEG